MTNQHITDEGQFGKYFHFMLNMADDDLDVYEYRLLGHYRRVCGANNNPCTESVEETARKIKMSTGKVSQTRQSLKKKRWIRLLKAKNNALHVDLIDRMADNVARYAKSSPDETPSEDKPSPHEPPFEPSPDEDKPSPHEDSLHQMKTKPSPHEGKNQHIKNQQSNNQTTETTPSSEVLHDPAVGADVDDAILKLIQPEIQKLLLPQSDQAALLALGPVQALAIAWSAQGDHVRNPGGLAKHLMGNGGPPDEQIARAQAAVELRTLDGDQIDHHLRHRAGTASSNPEEPPPNWKYFQLGDAPSPELPDEAPHESLNFKHRDRTVWEAYKAALAELEWDPRVMPHERAMYADLRLARYEAETQTLIVAGDQVAAGGLAQRISSQLGLDITMEFEAREETA